MINSTLYRSLLIPITGITILSSQLPVYPSNGVQAIRIARPAFVTLSKGSAMGSGAVIDPSGLIITNHHVVGSGGSVEVQWLNGRTAMGQVIGGNAQADLALVRLNGASNLPFLKVNTATPEPGETVYAIGSPFGDFKGSVSTGVVSRVTGTQVQHDAAVNSGNSGGPLINSRGELIGVNNSIYTGSDKDEGFVGLSFAISIPVVQRFLQANNGRAQMVNTPSPDAQGVAPAINTNPSTPSINPAITQPQPQQQAPVNIAFSGSLTQGDKQSGGKYYDLYRFNANAGQSLTFQMGSPTFWGKLGVMDPYGRMISINGTGNSNPSLTITIPQTGSYFLIASSAQAGAQGEYKVIGGPAQSTQLARYKLTSFNPNLTYYIKPLEDLYKWLLGLFKTSHK